MFNCEMNNFTLKVVILILR